MFAYPPLRFMRSAFVGFFCFVAMLLSAVAPASAQTADPRWGILADIAENDYQVVDYLVTVRWENPGKRLVWTNWLGMARTTVTFERDNNTGIISARRSGGDRYPSLVVSPNGELVEERSGKRAVWAEPGGGYRWSEARLRPLAPGGLRERLAMLIASNKVRAANPNLLNTSQLAEVVNTAPGTI